MPRRDEVLSGTEYGLSRFSRFLEFYRRERGLSQAGLAHRIGKTPQYISALELQKGAHVPSVRTLKSLINVLVLDEKTGYTDFQAASDLAFSALDMAPLSMPTSFSQELEREKKEPKGSTIWVITDFLLEAQERQFARSVLSNIVEREMKYNYFISSSLGSRLQWERAYKWMENEAKNLENGLTKLNQQVSVFELPDCAFISRLRIINPHGPYPEGHYDLGGLSRNNYVFLPVPIELVVRTVDTLSELLITLEDEKGQQSENNPVVGHEELGFIRRLFP